MENKNNNNENRVTKLFKSIVEAVKFSRENKEKKCKLQTVTGSNDYYVSYLLNQKSED